MSHEIRTPLNAILGFSQLLTMGKVKQEQQEVFYKHIHYNGKHLLNLINDILEISKIEAGVSQYIESEFDVKNLLLDLQSIFNTYMEDAYMVDGTLRRQTAAYIKLDTIKINDNVTTDYDIHRTLLQLNLSSRLNPGDSINFYFGFTSKLPYASGRYGYLGSHYDVANWFPTPVVYDKEGWHLHQHIDNEFYQEWGDFKVDITVPKGFIVGATGNLINAEIAMQDTSKEVRDWYLHNIEDTTSTTTWQYEAKNVHDFAWTTDPEYRYISGNWNGINVHYLVMRYNYEYWKKEFKAGLESVKFFSEMVGRYPYDQITIADTYITSGGMEYPNIVFINT